MFALFGIVFFGSQFNLRLKVASLLLFFVLLQTPNIFNPHSLNQAYFYGLGLVALGISSKVFTDTWLVRKALAFTCLAQCTFLGFEYFGINLQSELLGAFAIVSAQTFHANEYSLSGSLGHINHSAALIAVTSAFLSTPFLIIPLAFLLLAKSTLPLVCFAFVVYSRFVSTKKAWIWMAILACVAVFANDQGYFGLNQRGVLWKKFFEWNPAPFSGSGFGVILSEFRKVIPNAHHLHNEFLELYAVAGILGLLVSFYLIAPLFKRSRSENICAQALIVNSLGNFTFSVAPLFLVFCACYALTIKEKES